MQKTRNMVKAAIFLAMGIVLPLIFHMTGIAGRIFLPMHIPVLLAGMITGPVYGLIIGMASPVLGFLISGMPPPPIMQIMVFELGAYGLISGILYSKGGVMNIYLSLITAQTGGRVIYGIVFWALGRFLGYNIPQAISVGGAIMTGLPGILIQLIMIPVIIRIYELHDNTSLGIAKDR